MRRPVEFVRGKVRHGTASGYTYGCRCAECTKARSEQVAEWRRQNPHKVRQYRALASTREERGTTRAAHGTRTRYAAGCRCEACRGCQRAYQREYRQGRSQAP